jgi:hypothetical protein
MANEDDNTTCSQQDTIGILILAHSQTIKETRTKHCLYIMFNKQTVYPNNVHVYECSHRHSIQW